jgi:tetratricopeptide (TPR) repeat protein
VKPRSGVFLAAIAVLVALSIGIQIARDRRYQPYEPDTAMLWIQSGPLMKRLALGYDTLLSDIYWMRSVVYYGGQRLRADGKRGYELLAPMLDLVTTLDPRFTVAYRFGSIFLTEAYPSGPGRPDQSIALLQKGIERDPGKWEYMHDIGFVYYWWLHDYEQAAEWFRRAEAAGGPSWLGPLAANTLAAGGSRDQSRALWRQIYETTDSDWIKKTAERSFLQLDALDIVDALNAVADRFEAREGRRATTWEELVRGERLRGVPVDPTGVPYELAPSTGRIGLSPQSSLWPPPREPGSAGSPTSPPSPPETPAPPPPAGARS